MSAKCLPIPVVAPLYTVKIIDDSGRGLPTWKTLRTCYGPVPAQAIIRAAGLSGAWLCMMGGREWLSAK